MTNPILNPSRAVFLAAVLLLLVLSMFYYYQSLPVNLAPTRVPPTRQGVVANPESVRQTDEISLEEVDQATDHASVDSEVGSEPAPVEDTGFVEDENRKPVIAMTVMDLAVREEAYELILQLKANRRITLFRIDENRENRVVFVDLPGEWSFGKRINEKYEFAKGQIRVMRIEHHEHHLRIAFEFRGGELEWPRVNSVDDGLELRYAW